MISIPYFALVLVSFLCYWLIPVQRMRNWLLTGVSFAFLYFTDKSSILVVLGLTAFTYLLGVLIARARKKDAIHALGVVGILIVLIVFKYLGLLEGIIKAAMAFMEALPDFDISRIIMPLGISYIVFKHISYLTDVKWGLCQPGRPDDLLLYSSLFTIYVAGPIERFERFQPQAENKRISFAWKDVESGFTRIVFGLFKKLVIADWLGHFIAPVWADPAKYSLALKALALVGYSFQIYYDFAGYSDIAIGSSRLFGFRIMENFRQPYLAPNISQFWRRWHISLSDWIRDYVFFPLSRLSSRAWWTMVLVPVIAMALCGLWHGAAWHFVLWGIWHGVGLSIYQLWSRLKRKHLGLARLTNKKSFSYLAILATFCYVSAGWLLFR